MEIAWQWAARIDTAGHFYIPLHGIFLSLQISFAAAPGAMWLIFYCSFHFIQKKKNNKKNFLNKNFYIFWGKMFSCHSTWCAVSTLFCPIFRVRTSSIFWVSPRVMITMPETFWSVIRQHSKYNFPHFPIAAISFHFISSPLRRYELGLEPQVEFQLHENMQIMKQVLRGIN